MTTRSALAMAHALKCLSDGTLSIDDQGRIWRHWIDGPWYRRRIKPRRAEFPTAKGYLGLRFYAPGSYSSGRGRSSYAVLAHCVIWTWFKGPIPTGLQINHKDLKKANNRLSNLELMTGPQNIQHSYSNGRPRPWSKVQDGGNWRLGKPLISARRKRAMVSMFQAGVSVPAISKKTGVSKTHVSRIIKKGDST